MLTSSEGATAIVSVKLRTRCRDSALYGRWCRYYSSRDDVRVVMLSTNAFIASADHHIYSPAFKQKSLGLKPFNLTINIDITFIQLLHATLPTTLMLGSASKSDIEQACSQDDRPRSLTKPSDPNSPKRVKSTMTSLLIALRSRY